jgi:Ca-activated chloride channel family protein
LSFEAPGLLVFLLAVPAAIAGYLWLERHRGDRAAAWTSPALAPNLVPHVPGWRRHLPVALLLAGATLLLVGFARPKATITVKRHDATVVLVIDQSGSMASKDVRPTRLGAARAAAEKLVATVPKSYEIAVITFSDHAALVAPPTLDRSVVLGAIERTRSGPQGTALTEAVSRAVTVADSVPGSAARVSAPAVVLVFSDGAQTAHGLTPDQVGKVAARAHIPVSAVAVGTPNGVVDQKITGGYTEQIAVPVESDTLRTIAQETHGRVVTTFDPTFLRNIVDDLGSRVGHERKGVEVTSAAAGGGMVLMLVGAFLGGVWFRRVP